MKKYNLKNIAKNAILFFVGASVQHFYTKQFDSFVYRAEIAAAFAAANDAKILSATEENRIKLNSMEQTMSNWNEILLKNSSIIDEPKKNKLLSIVDSLKEEHGSLSKIFQGEYSHENFDLAKDRIQSLDHKVNELEEVLKKIIFGEDKMNYIPDFNLDKYYEFLDSLSLIQEAAFLQILLYILLMLIASNFVGIFFGNELIKYFKLEQKFPSLATFFKFRSTFQRYYLMWTILELFLVCLAAIGINIFIFIMN